MSDLTLLVMNDDERRLRQVFEQRIEALLESTGRQILLLGEALHGILHQRLYRETHASFDSYCEARWGITGRAGRKAADTYAVRKTMTDYQESNPAAAWNLLEGLEPAHIQQLRKLPPSEQPIAWQESRKESLTPRVEDVERVVARKLLTAEEESESNRRTEQQELEKLRDAEVRDVASRMLKRLRSITKPAQDELVKPIFTPVLTDLEKVLEKLQGMC